MRRIEKEGRMKLSMRVERMCELLARDAPTDCLCEEAALIFRAACTIDPESTGAALACALCDDHAHAARICDVCGDADARAGSTLCATCNFKAATEDDR